MNRKTRIGELQLKRSLLKGEGKFSEAIPFQLELIELLQEERVDQNRIAMAHNMASVLYLHTKLYSSAEWHARRALELNSDKSAKGHESLGAYNRVMAQILASRYEFEEAALFGQTAITEYSFWHTPADDFLASLIAEVETMKNRTWTAPE